MSFPDFCNKCLKYNRKTYQSSCCDNITCFDCYKTLIYDNFQVYSSQLKCMYCKEKLLSFLISFDILLDVYIEDKNWCADYINLLIEFLTTKKKSNNYMRDTNKYKICHNKNDIFKKIVNYKRCCFTYTKYNKLIRECRSLTDATFLLNLYYIKKELSVIVVNHDDNKFELLTNERYQ